MVHRSRGVWWALDFAGARIPAQWSARTASLPVILLCPIGMFCAAAVTSSPRCRLTSASSMHIVVVLPAP
jgi:hypothetical protein